MKHIRQKHMNGCGVATVAMLLGMTYNQVLKHMYPKRWFWQPVKPFSIGDALWSLGWEYNEFVLKYYHIQQITKAAIFIIKWTDEDRSAFPFYDYETHAVAWDPQTKSILDPALKYAHPLEYYQKRACGYYQLAEKRKKENKL